MQEDKAIIYPKDDGGIAILWPSPQYPIVEIAKKDVPKDVPYRIINVSDLPREAVFRNAWVADFSLPDGYGQGYSEWFAQQAMINSGVQAPEPVNEKDRPWPTV